MSEIIKSKKPNKEPKKSVSEVKKADKSFLDYLEDIRRLIFTVFIIVLIFTVVAFLFKGLIFDTIILSPKKPDFVTNRLLFKVAQFFGTAKEANSGPVFDIMNIEMAGQFKAHMTISFIMGLMISFPIIVVLMWRFVKPMISSEYTMNINFTLFMMGILFSLGVLFGYFIIVPLTINFLGDYTVSAEVTNRINFRSYSSIITSVSFSIGLVFELPIVIYFLSKIGIATPAWLKKFRKVAFILFLSLSAIITPPDVFSQVLVCLPLVLLYEISILISGRIYRKRLATY